MKLMLLLLVLTGQLCLGQVKKVVKIQGTNYSLVPPEGFVSSATYPGFEDVKNRAVILLIEMPIAYKGMAEELESMVKADENKQFINQELIKFNGSDAIWAIFSELRNGNTQYIQMLYFGDGDKTISLTGGYPEAAKSLELKVKAALMSTIRTPQTNNPIHAAFKTEGEHVKIPGTRCSLIPPSGFVASTTFGGFQNVENGASIMVNEIPAPYQSIANGFTADALKSKGMTLLKKQTIIFQNSNATLLDLAQSANGTTYLKQMLVFGTAKVTILVNGIYPIASKDIAEEIKKSLLSTTYDSLQNENPVGLPSYAISTEDTDFKFVKQLAGSSVYSVDGKIPTEKPTLILGRSIAKVSVQDRKKYCEDRLKKLPRGEANVIEKIEDIVVDNLRGYEIVANGKTKDDKAELIYQVMLFNEDGGYYIIVGQSKEAFDKYLKSFKKMTRSFKIN